MNLDNLAGMFSQRSGVQRSIGNSIMSAIIGFMAQKMIGQGIGSMLSGSGSGSNSSGGIQSMLSGLVGGGGLNRDHELVRHVQQNARIQDPETARQYTQHGVDILNEQSRSNPQGLQSLFGGFLVGGGGQGGQQKKEGSGGVGVGGMLGDILGG
jgi:hypothetical protein